MVFFWCLIAAVCIGVCFKLFPTFRINSFNAIVVNYTVCLALGSILDPEGRFPFSGAILNAPWFWYDALLGVIFITGFNLTAYGIRTVGLTLTTLTQRMSIILTVSFAVVLFHESFGLLEFTGLLLALTAIVAINQRAETISLRTLGPFPLILILILVFSALVEIILYYVEKTGVVGKDQLSFTTHGFGSAGLIGWMIIAWQWMAKKKGITGRDFLAGILLGVPNFFSIYLLLVMLNQGWKGSVMYPLLNVSVMLLSTLVAVILFREKLNRINWIGIGLATAAILLISYAHNAEDWKTIF